MRSVPKSRRRGPGRGSALTFTEIERVNMLFISGASKAEIARMLGTSPAAVRHALAVPQARQFQEDARALLREHRASFVADWLLASRVGAKLGSHKPAKDALIAIGEVNAEPTTPAVTVSMNFVLPGLPTPASAQTNSLPVVNARPALPRGEE